MKYLEDILLQNKRTFRTKCFGELNGESFNVKTILNAGIQGVIAVGAGKTIFSG
jgi:hypothetical protein